MKKLKNKYRIASRDLKAVINDTTTTEAYKIKQIQTLVPRFMKLQNALIDLGVRPTRVLYNI